MAACTGARLAGMGEFPHFPAAVVRLTPERAEIWACGRMLMAYRIKERAARPSRAARVFAVQLAVPETVRLASVRDSSSRIRA